MHLLNLEINSWYHKFQFVPRTLLYHAQAFGAQYLGYFPSIFSTYYGINGQKISARPCSWHSRVQTIPNYITHGINGNLM